MNVKPTAVSLNGAPSGMGVARAPPACELRRVRGAVPQHTYPYLPPHGSPGDAPVKFRVVVPIDKRRLYLYGRGTFAPAKPGTPPEESVPMLNFSLLTPLRQHSEDGLAAVEFKPKRLRQWLTGLTELEPDQAVEQLLKAVARLKAEDLPDKLRQDLLDVYRPEINGVFEDFDSPSFQQLLRADQRNNRLAEDIGHLTSALAAAYKGIVRSCYRKAAGAKSEERLRRAIYCAMEQTINRLLHAFRLYTQVPARTYHQLHWLYRLAEGRQMLYLPVICAGERAASESIGKLYKQFVLFSLADPFHMGRREVLDFFRFFERYATATQIKKDNDWKRLQGHFLIDLAGDGPPIPTVKLDKGNPPSRPRVVDTRAVVTAAIRDQINQAVSARHREYAERGKRLIASIVPDFEGIRPRKEARQPTYRQVSVVLGIEAVHRALTDACASEGHTRASSEPSAAPLLPRWTILNEAPGGYRLSGKHGDLADGQVGDLVGIVEQAGTDFGTGVGIAIIRWIRGLEGESLVLGTERLDAPAVAVSCRPSSGGPQSQPCLLLSGSRDGRLPATLLCPTGVFSENQPVEITAADQQLLVRLTDRVMHTPALERFRFRHEKAGR